MSILVFLLCFEYRAAFLVDDHDRARVASRLIQVEAQAAPVDVCEGAWYGR